MMVDYGVEAAAVIGGAITFVGIVAVIGKWRTLERKSQVRFARFLKLISVFIVIGLLYFGLFDRTPRGIECHKSTSPDGVYMAERCLLNWIPGGNSEYVGRLFDARSGKLLAQHTFGTPDPDLSWSSGVTYSLEPDGPLHYFGPSVGFSIGDGGDDSTFISLPPSRWDRLLASRPRL